MERGQIEGRGISPIVQCQAMRGDVLCMSAGVPVAWPAQGRALDHPASSARAQAGKRSGHD